MNTKTNKGLLLVFTGNGKGKTSAALGTIIRTLGNNGKVAFIQFMKGKKESCERIFFKQINEIDVFTFGAGWYKNNREKEEQIKKAQEGLELAKELILSQKYQLVVLDELNYIVSYNLLEVDSVLKILEQREQTDIVLTGRNAHEKIIEIADTVTELVEIKHAFKNKIPAKKGIDF